MSAALFSVIRITQVVSIILWVALNEPYLQTALYSWSYIIGPTKNMFPNNTFDPRKMLQKNVRVISNGDVVIVSFMKHMLAAINDCTSDALMSVPFLQSFSVSFRHFP